MPCSHCRSQLWVNTEKRQILIDPKYKARLLCPKCIHELYGNEAEQADRIDLSKVDLNKLKGFNDDERPAD